MKINTQVIARLNPCESRFKNFKDQYPGFSGSSVEFLSLDNITYNDKVWVCIRLMSRNQKFYWARACARSVLEIFESQRPNDPAIRNLLNHLDSIKDVNILTSKDIEQIAGLKRAADAAAYAAAYAAATFVRNAAAYAADAAAYAAASSYTAAYAAAYVVNAAAYVVNAAAYVVNAAAYAHIEQEEYNLIILKEIMDMDI